MKNDGYSENTTEPIGRKLRNLAKHIDLNNPDEVKEHIAKANLSNGYKENLVNAYNHYAVARTGTPLIERLLNLFQYLNIDSRLIGRRL